MNQIYLKSGEFNITRLDNRHFFYHKCLIVDYLAASPPFADYGLKSVVDAVTRQMITGCYFVAMKGNKIHGYAGWLLTTKDIAGKWHKGDGPLTPVNNNHDAVVFTILAVSDTDLLMPMVRTVRRSLGNTSIFWKRHIKGRGLRPRQLRRP